MPPKNPVGQLRNKKNRSGVEQSFLDFVSNKNLYIEEQNKLWEFWKRGGSPFIKKHDKKGRANYITSKISDDGYSRFSEDIPDTMNIYSPSLEKGFLAEIAHGIQYARKEGESLKDWSKRYRSQDDTSHEELHRYKDENRYGREKDNRWGNLKELLFPEKKLEFPVDTYEAHGTRDFGYGEQTFSYPEILWEEYDKSTKLGINGSKPTQEFEAHSIIEPELESELNKVRESIPGYKKDIVSDINMMKWLKKGFIPGVIKTGIGATISAKYAKSLMDYVNEN